MGSSEVKKSLEEAFKRSESKYEWNQHDLSSDDEVDADFLPPSVISMKSHDDPKSFKFSCTMENCKAVYRKKWLLDDHIRKHKKERPFHCTIDDCTKSFTKEPHLKRHKIQVHEKACEQICDFKDCGLVYNNKYSLKKHKNQVHNATKYPFFCNECCTGFQKKWMLNQHNYIHNGEPPFKCTKCNIGFTIQRELTKHNRNHKTYTCNCGKIFERWSVLRTHKKSCPSKEDNVCPICDKRFNRKENLTAHIKHHQESYKSFHCPYMDCTRRYQYKKNLNFHISSYHEEKGQDNLPCTKCGKIFLKQAYLNRHVKVVHSEQPKIVKPRMARKDKGKPKAFTAATLAGLKLSQKEHIELLKTSKTSLTIKLSKIDLPEVEKEDGTPVKTYSSDEHLAHINVQGSNSLKETSLIEPSKNTACKDINKLNFEQIIVNSSISLETNTQQLETSANKILENEQLPDDLINTAEGTMNEFSDEILLACNNMLNTIEECLA